MTYGNEPCLANLGYDRLGGVFRITILYGLGLFLSENDRNGLWRKKTTYLKIGYFNFEKISLSYTIVQIFIQILINEGEQRYKEILC